MNARLIEKLEEFIDLKIERAIENYHDAHCENPGIRTQDSFQLRIDHLKAEMVAWPSDPFE